jgi:hypothetical protein
VTHTTWQGILVSIHVADGASQPMRALGEARIVAGVGIPGDRYAEKRGTYSPRHHIDRQITLIEQETLEALARDHGVALAPHEHRRNLTTCGVALNHLVGRYFKVGGGAMRRPAERALPLSGGVAGRKVFKPLINRRIERM